MVDSELYNYMGSLLEQTSSYFHRYLYSEINWKARMIGILGARGVGKSTMVLQYIKENPNTKSLYISADMTYFLLHQLTEVADEFCKDGGELLVIDEIHTYTLWSKELKQIYDTHPDLRIIFTGSSILDISKGVSDLSRRVVDYTLYGLSFREFLKFKYDIDIPIYSINDILDHKVQMDSLLHPLPYYREYIQMGYYPFFKEGDYSRRLQNVITKTIETDVAQFGNLKAITAKKLRKMLAVISTLTPFKPSYDSLASEIGVSRNNISDYLILLERVQLIGQLRDDTGGLRGLGKVEKIYLDNTNLMYSLASQSVDIGSLRETFFYNQMRVCNEVISSRISDFAIDNLTFEIGGKSKGSKQIKTAEKGFIIKDDIEFGHDNVIPLWHFGLNY